MRCAACVVALALAGCYDFDKFAVHDLAGADLTGADLAGQGDLGDCAPVRKFNLATCRDLTFENGLMAAGLLPVAAIPGVDVSVRCGRIHIHVDAGGSHDFWNDENNAFRAESPEPINESQAFLRFSADLTQEQQFVGLYFVDVLGRISTVRASIDPPGDLVGKAAVFTSGASAPQPPLLDAGSIAKAPSMVLQIHAGAIGVTPWDFRVEDGSSGYSYQVPNLRSGALKLGLFVGTAPSGGNQAPAFDADLESVALCP